MLKLDLAQLERERSIRLPGRVPGLVSGRVQVRVQGEIPAHDPLWEGTGWSFETPVSVDLLAQLSGSGQVVLQGTASATLLQECRRCLEPVRTRLAEELTLVYVAPELLAGDGGDDEARPIPHGVSELELGEAVREELVLAIDPYVVCDPDCLGLCPHCGVRLNEQSCDCVREEPDARWDVLRTLKGE